MNKEKVRIYELSKELNLDNKDILGICAELNIAAKSHSSTITETQAERIRAVAERQLASQSASSSRGSTPSTKDASGSSSKNFAGRSKGGRKQQILELRKHSQPTSKNTGKSGVQLAPPPRMPVKPQPSSSNQIQQPYQPEKELDQEDTQVESVTPQAQETIVENEKVDTPELLQPPARPSARQKSPEPPQVVQPPIKPKKVGNLATPSKPTPVQTKAESELEESAQAETTQKQPKESLKAPPKLHRPQKPKPPQPPKKAQPESAESEPATDSESVVTEEDEDILELPEKIQPKLKRPTPARPAKSKKVWEDEEDEQEVKAKSGKATKTKRRAQPVVEDEDEELEAVIGSSSASAVTFSQSIARPPKPVTEQPAKTAASAAQPKKPVPKTDRGAVSSGRTDSRERRRENKGARELPEIVTLTGSLTVRELADLLNISETEIIKSLFFKGLAVNITQTLDLATARMVAEELEVAVETPEETSAAAKVTEMIDEEDLENLQRRPPVVTIMGHVDHGKTTLLDAIRKTKVAEGEAGGITQHIGAYHVDVEHDGQIQQVVFLDTPGHEAFTAMRARGTRVTDIAILVVAADDGVQPQTKEAISHAKAAEVPIVVAVNKIDKPEAQPDRVMQELTEQGLVPEEWGGETIMVPVSAIKGENLDTLLEMILLVAEIEQLEANPTRLAKGTVIEANLDKARGPVATLLVQNGTLRVGDVIVAGSALGKIRAMIDDRGNRVEEASPSFAVEVLGLSELPAAGDEFEVFASEKEARAVAGERYEEKREDYLQKTMSSRRVSLSSLSAQAQEGELKELNLILKADVQGSVEAILGALQQLPQDEVQIRILLSSAGEITETDIDLAAASGAVIIGFSTTITPGARAAADREGVDVREYNIIYQLLDDIQAAMEGLLEPEEVEESLGQAEVRAVFPVGRGAVAGCYVQSGKVVRNRQIRVRRGDQVIYQGPLDSLKRIKENVREVNAGFECGIGVDKFNDWKEGDTIEAYQMVMKRRTLATK